MPGGFAFAGQRCTANRRAVVDARHYDRFLETLTAAAGGVAQAFALVRGLAGSIPVEIEVDPASLWVLVPRGPNPLWAS